MLEEYVDNKNNYIAEQNKNHKTVGTMAMEMCFKYKQGTEECTKYPALQELKILLRNIVTDRVKTV